MTETANILSVDSVSATYSGSIAALHGVSLTVAPREIRAILGANGAGKTTTLHAISNLLSAERGVVTSGSIRFDGLDVLRTSPADLVRAGLVPVLEGRHVFRSLTIEENLKSGAYSRGSTRAETRADLERTYDLFPSIAPKRHIKAGLSSGGEQQMVAIGRALMSRPRLLLLDEPSMGLAPIVVQAIFETLRALNKNDGLAILMAEQNAAVALRYAHTATVIENGVGVLSDTSDALRARADIQEFYLGSTVAVRPASNRRERRFASAFANEAPIAAE